MAAGLGHMPDARLFARRGQWWRNVWDSRPSFPPSAQSRSDAYATGQLRPRTVDGTWLTPYNPVDAAQQFH
jgi:putative alpha-1,2-mannosidase